MPETEIAKLGEFGLIEELMRSVDLKNESSIKGYGMMLQLKPAAYINI